MDFRLFTILVLVLLLATACNNKMNKMDNSTTSTSKVLIKVGKFRGKCIKCPHYTLEILDSPKANMIGKFNVPVLGESSFDIEKATYQNLILAFQEVNFSEFSAEYLTSYRDLAKTTISYLGHTVSFHDRKAPQELLVLSKLIDDYVIPSN